MGQLTESLASKFSLTDGESDLVAGDPTQAANLNAAHDLYLIGRVIIDKEMSIGLIRAHTLRLLHPVKGATIRPIAPNIFFIKFNHHLDKKKAMGGCPWVLDRHALILEPIDPRDEARKSEPL